jgi:hypothetical protein
VLKLAGVLGEALGIVLKVAGAVVQTFLSPFIAGLTNVVEAIRGGMNAAFGYIGEQIDWASQKIKDFYAYMSKVPIIGRAFASGEQPMAQAAAGAEQASADAGTATQDNLNAEMEMYKARLQNEQAIQDARKQADAEQADRDFEMFKIRRENEQAIADARRREEEEATKAAQQAADEAAKEADRRAKEAAEVGEKMAAKQADIDAATSERVAALGGKSNESLKATDVRSSEGMSQFIALATGREDPAIAEYRKQTQKLEELKAELRALGQQQVDILGAAA